MNNCKINEDMDKSKKGSSELLDTILVSSSKCSSTINEDMTNSEGKYCLFVVIVQRCSFAYNDWEH